MIDVHSHVLPGMDDGSKNTEESIEILKKMQEQGVERVAATSHFYADRETLDTFLRRREHSYRRLCEAMDETDAPLPKVFLGAEVWYFEGISHSDSLKPLRAEGTDILLLEMPFSKWTDRMLSEVAALSEEDDFTVLLAHIERYLKWQKRETLDSLLQRGVKLQSNAEAFLERRTARKVMKMLERGQIHLLGSDCHNRTSRPPNYGDAIEKIRSRLGEDAITYLADMERLLYPEPEGVH